MILERYMNLRFQKTKEIRTLGIRGNGKKTKFRATLRELKTPTIPTGNCNYCLENSRLQTSILKCSISYVLNFRGLIKLFLTLYIDVILS